MTRAFLQVNCRFQVYTTQDTTGMIRAFLQVNCRFQVHTTQDTTEMIRAFLQVNCRRFQVYTTHDTTRIIGAFLQHLKSLELSDLGFELLMPISWLHIECAAS